MERAFERLKAANEKGNGEPAGAAYGSGFDGREECSGRRQTTGTRYKFRYSPGRVLTAARKAA